MSSFERKIKRKKALKQKKEENKKNNNNNRQENSNIPKKFYRKNIIDIRNRSIFSMMSKRGYQK